MPIYERLSQTLYQLRRERGWSIDKMAEECGLSTRHYGNLEKGRHLPRLDTALRIAKKFDISLDEWKEDEL